MDFDAARLSDERKNEDERGLRGGGRRESEIEPADRTLQLYCSCEKGIVRDRR